MSDCIRYICCYVGSRTDDNLVDVGTFDEIPEPWRTYAMMLDAATSRESTDTDYTTSIIPDVGAKYTYRLSGIVMYLFYREFWIEHGGKL